MIIDTDTFVVTKDNLTPLLRTQICNLKGESGRIITEGLYDLIGKDEVDEAELKVSQLKEVWGEDSELLLAECIIKMIRSWK